MLIVDSMVDVYCLQFAIEDLLLNGVVYCVLCVFSCVVGCICVVGCVMFVVCCVLCVPC